MKKLSPILVTAIIIGWIFTSPNGWERYSMFGVVVLILNLILYEVRQISNKLNETPK